MKEIDPTLNYDTQMELCRTNLPNYDIIVLMDNWKKSPGAKQEFVWASQLGLKIMRDSESDYRSLEWKLTTQRELNIHPIKNRKSMIHAMITGLLIVTEIMLIICIIGSVYEMYRDE